MWHRDPQHRTHQILTHKCLSETHHRPGIQGHPSQHTHTSFKVCQNPRLSAHRCLNIWQPLHVMPPSSCAHQKTRWLPNRQVAVNAAQKQTVQTSHKLQSMLQGPKSRGAVCLPPHSHCYQYSTTYRVDSWCYRVVHVQLQTAGSHV